jgi:hypothetical protein
VLLEDPLRVLRGGTSTLMNIDFASPEAVDTQLVTDYVEEAVSKFDDFLHSRQT